VKENPKNKETLKSFSLSKGKRTMGVWNFNGSDSVMQLLHWRPSTRGISQILLQVTEEIYISKESCYIVATFCLNMAILDKSPWLWRFFSTKILCHTFLWPSRENLWILFNKSRLFWVVINCFSLGPSACRIVLRMEKWNGWMRRKCYGWSKLEHKAMTFFFFFFFGEGFVLWSFMIIGLACKGCCCPWWVYI
jgi:hypothetical protein